MSNKKNNNSEIEKVLLFLKNIGIQIIEKQLDSTTFLPGLALGSNCIYVDFEKLENPGDLLHEAGHLAVTDSKSRKQIERNLNNGKWPTQGEEIAAILWSYAALTYLNLDPSFVFHSNGYKGNSEWFISNFTNANYIGLPFLEWAGLTLGDIKANLENKEAFPVMQKWIRD
ncbi:MULTISPECIES: hypothetical protein [unclassified Flavobacterium]|uniref:hypothetical protein n=1 Tax=unclassified Flavobacterium TaxID=196869 RepID=UPI001290A1E1|nr:MULTISPECIES: hypothetical protein [unclassified Flavobacterium]MQP52199.1 hypothetical protein [Flavobacterium sp. LMO9]MQP62069.1 hypothetical protein [Flavobacterium sp. LMO6]